MKLLSILVIIYLGILCQAQANERIYLSKTLAVENLDKSILVEGEKVRNHLKTSQNYKIKGWNHKGDSMLFIKSGDLFQSKKGNGKFRKVLDFKGIGLGDAKKALVCGEPGYLFSADKDNDEYNRIYAGTSRQFKPYKLSKGIARNTSIRVSNNKNQVSYASAEKNTGVWKLILQSICDKGNYRELKMGDYPTYPQDFHPNDKVLVTSSPDESGYKVSQWDLESGKEAVLLRSQNPVSSIHYSADGNYLFFVNNDESEYKELYRMNLKSKDILAIFPQLGADIDFARVSENRKKMVINLNQLGLSTLMVIDTEKLSLIGKPSSKPLGVVSSMYFSPNGETLAINLSQPAVPPRSGLYNYKNDTFKALTGGFKKNQNLVEVIPRITSYPTFDSFNGERRKIPVLLYKPESATSHNPAPVLIEVHGGPASQARPSFSRLYHYYVSKLGIAVIRPNVRGSTGYGKNFEKLDQVKKREDSIKDIGALLNWIDTQPELDSKKIMISGGSYGGYVSLASMVAYGDKLVGAISRVGITDFESFLNFTEPYRRNNRRKEYGNEQSKDIQKYFKDISPLQNIQKIKKPVLIIQGGKDPRVPAQQAEDMVKSLKEKGNEVFYLLAKDEGHKFGKRKNRVARNGAQIQFIKRYLLENNH